MPPQIKQAKLETLEAIIKGVEGMLGKPHPNELFFMSGCPSCGQETNDKFVTDKITGAIDERLSDLLTKLQAQKELIENKK